MIVLDTDVISELMRPKPHEGVLAWVATQSPAQLCTTYINQAEILYGIAALSAGRRRAALAAGDRIATRDISGFSGCGLTLVDPWSVS